MRQLCPVPSPAARRVVAAVPLVLAACRRRAVAAPGLRVRLPPRLAGLLDHLDRNRPTAAGELARRLRVTPATISIQVARLLRLRLVSRTPDRADGRRVLLRLTAAGARLRDALTLLDPDCVQGLLQRLPAKEREQAVSGIESLGRVAAQPASFSRRVAE
jgi:DNA-binding MarR family transcriptional regulator